MLAILDVRATWAVFTEPIFPEILPGYAHTLEVPGLLGIFFTAEGIPKCIIKVAMLGIASFDVISVVGW